MIPPNPLLFLTRSHLRPPRHSTTTDPSRIIRCRRRRCQPQQTSTSIAPTIAPARYANNLHTLSLTKPSPLLRGPKVFFTLAKMGAGISEVFAYFARRVMTRWEWELGRGPREWGPLLEMGSIRKTEILSLSTMPMYIFLLHFSIFRNVRSINRLL